MEVFIFVLFFLIVPALSSAFCAPSISVPWWWWLGGRGICFLVLYPSSVVTYYCLLLWTRFIMGRGNFYFPNIVSILGRLACLGLRNEASSVFLAYPFSQCLLNSDLWVIGPWIENSFLPVPRSSTLLLIPVQDPESKSFPCFYPGPEDLCF